jgi:hypothetical protein
MPDNLPTYEHAERVKDDVTLLIESIPGPHQLSLVQEAFEIYEFIALLQPCLPHTQQGVIKP